MQRENEHVHRKVKAIDLPERDCFVRRKGLLLLRLSAS